MSRFRAITILFAIFLPVASMAGELSGTATYRERIAMPAEATFQAILYDISNNDQVEIGLFESPGDAGPPYTFTFEYADDTVTEDGLYSTRVQILLGGNIYVVAGALLEGFPANPQTLELVMVRPGIAPASSEAGDQ